MKHTTIAAISTPFGSGGIGIIRISGENAVQIGTILFQRQSNHTKGALQSHRVHHGYIVDPETRKTVDEVLLVAMRAPKSYTREDVVEIHSHSGTIVLRQIFELVIRSGAVVAEPGEFTKRAFLNGRIDLTQAEAVADIIDAKSGAALRMANDQLRGGLTHKVEALLDTLQDIRVHLEASIDFPEDVEDRFPVQKMLEDIDQGVIGPIKGLIENYGRSHFFRDGVKMAIIGRPNVGKSSLMNRLLDRERAIVTAVPGTTRDVIEETFHVKGLPVIIVDTAGLHEAQGEVEKIGIERTKQAIRTADIVFFMVDTSRPISQEDLAIHAEIAEKNYFIVQNKIDIDNNHGAHELPSGWDEKPIVRISALEGTNFDQLRNTIWDGVVGHSGVLKEIGIVPNLRQKIGLEKCLESVRRARQALTENMPDELVASDIIDAKQQLQHILGDEYQEDILDQIFSRFCIGK